MTKLDAIISYVLIYESKPTSDIKIYETQYKLKKYERAKNLELYGDEYPIKALSKHGYNIKACHHMERM